jgi:hypothetical protein
MVLVSAFWFIRGNFLLSGVNYTLLELPFDTSSIYLFYFIKIYSLYRGEFMVIFPIGLILYISYVTLIISLPQTCPLPHLKQLQEIWFIGKIFMDDCLLEDSVQFTDLKKNSKLCYYGEVSFPREKLRSSGESTGLVYRCWSRDGKALWWHMKGVGSLF